ncbi:MAG: FAD-dependent thymidylate synthase, partial [Candidatus Aenigmatarchaeota archaeon]
RLKQIVKKIGCETDEKVPSKWELFGDSQEKDVSIDIFGKSNDPFSISLSAYIRGSLSMFAQLVRQRQLLCNIEPLSSIAKKGRFVIPPSFDKEAKKIYKEIAEKSHEKQMDLLEKGKPEFVYYLLLGQEAAADVYAHSAGAFELSQARTCGTAQWEIRNFGTEVAKKLANLGYEKKVGPKCWREGIICTEPNTFKTKYNKCPVLSKRTSGEKLKLNEALELLKTEYEVFEVQIS